jgi:SAM-dependent methyltransferase
MNETSNMPELSSARRRMSIPGLDAWLRSAQGRYVVGWEQRELDRVVVDIFGFNALQIGLPQCPFLSANRIPLRQTVSDVGGADVLCEFTALPFAAHSTDLVILPHVLEFSDDPHQILREIERILIPEGQVVIIGFNPLSLWGLQRRLDCSGNFPWNGAYLSLTRLKDWLKLLGFEIDAGTLGCFAPPLIQEKWLQRWRFIENAGRRWWGFSGGVYVLRAVKRTHGMRLITPNWRTKAVRAKALRPVAHKEGHGHH